MKLTKLFSFAITITMLFSACNKDEFDAVDVPTIDAGTGHLTITLTDANSVRTRATDDGTEDEREIKKLEFYIFNQGGDRDTNHEYFAYTASQDKYTLAVTPGDGKQVLLAVNMNLGRLAGESLTQVKKAMHEAAITTPTAIPSTGIPMAGQVSGVEVVEEQYTNQEIEVSRLFSRLNAPSANGANVQITNIAELESIGLDPNATLSFELTGYVVINGIKKSFAFQNYGVANENDRWNPSFWTLGDVSNYTASEYENEHLGTVYSGSDYLTAEGVYVYENSPLRYEDQGSRWYEAATVYAFILKGELSDGTTTVTRYWRANIAKANGEDNNYQILRNAIYNVSISNIKTIGWGSPEEAEEEKPVIPDGEESAIVLEVKVAPWRVFNFETDI